jgi:hypothetical protein
MTEAVVGKVDRILVAVVAGKTAATTVKLPRTLASTLVFAVPRVVVIVGTKVLTPLPIAVRVGEVPNGVNRPRPAAAPILFQAVRVVPLAST